MQVVEASRWEFGIGFGMGQRNNILIDSKDININAFMHIAYYGDNFFFDNGELGYTFTQYNGWIVNLIGGMNSERQFFENFNQFGFAALDSNLPDAVVNQQNITKTRRSNPIDAGFELYKEYEWGDLQFQLNTDISNKHNGVEFWSGYSPQFSVDKFKVVSTVGIIYKSKSWTNYFYGVEPQEVITDPNTGNYIRSPYKASRAINPFYKVSISYPITNSWQAIGVYEAEYLDSSIYQSPIVKGKKIETLFVGLYYQF